MRHGHQRLRFGIDERRPVAADRLPQGEGQTVGYEV